MTAKRYTFNQKGERFEVIGQFGRGANQLFLVTKLLPGAKRGGVRIELATNADDEKELLHRLRKSFPDLTDFEPA